MAENVFISYRRTSDRATAHRLYDWIKQNYTLGRVFIDVQHIEPGQNFLGALERALEDTSMLLVLIGPNWLEGDTDQFPNRLNDPNDFVRREIQTALELGIPILPVCIDGASVPAEHELPRELTRFARSQATDLNSEKFERDARRVLQEMKQLLKKRRKGLPYVHAAGLALGGYVLGILSVVGLMQAGVLKDLATVQADSSGWGLSSIAKAVSDGASWLFGG